MDLRRVRRRQLRALRQGARPQALREGAPEAPRVHGRQGDGGFLVRKGKKDG